MLSVNVPYRWLLFIIVDAVFICSYISGRFMTIDGFQFMSPITAIFFIVDAILQIFAVFV